MPTILFDIDRTLFDTAKFVNLVLEEISRSLRVSRAEVEKVYRGYWSEFEATDHLPQNFSQYTAKQFQVDSLSSDEVKQLVLDIFNREDLYRDSVFSEAPDVISSMKNKGWKVGFFTEGNIDFQNSKLTYSELRKLAPDEMIFVFEEKTAPEALAVLPEGCVIVDDKLRVVVAMISEGRRAVWLNSQKQAESTQVPQIESLLQLPDLLSGWYLEWHLDKGRTK